ncbi:MAG: helix-turn-helix domain-containing protein [Promethearchaeota archaeon]
MKNEEILQVVMKKYNLSQSDLAKELNMVRSNITNIKNENVGFSKKAIAILISKFNVNAKVFFIDNEKVFLDE